MKTGFIILIDTLCGVSPAYFDEDGKPVIFETEKEAQVEMLEDYVSLLEQQVEEFKKGERDIEEIDTTLQEWVEYCDIDEEGKIYLESGELKYKR